MSDYWFTAKAQGSSTYSHKAETKQVELKDGDKFETDDPCEMLAFVAGWATDDGNTSVGEEWAGVVDALETACGLQTSLDGVPSSEPPAPGEDSDGEPSEPDDRRF
jgi:hypothetical protein